MRLLPSLRRAYAAGGLAEVGRWIGVRAYRRARSFTPYVRHARYGGVAVDVRTRLADHAVPRAWARERCDRPLYESTLVAGLRAHVRPGDCVVVVGAGHGVTTVVAAQMAGPSGTVEVFEASDDMAARTRVAVALNGVAGRVHLNYAVVSEEIAVWGDTRAPVVAPQDLPSCDVLELDCEGAELEILRRMTIRPRVILVETHGMFDASTAGTSALLTELGYDVVSDEIADATVSAYCEEYDIRVLTAVSETFQLPSE